MQALTNLLHSKFESLHVGESNNNMELNGLLYMDDLNLLTRDDVIISKFLWKIEEFLAEIGFCLNASKSARIVC